jgi:arylsulfatase A-like enzyme
MNLSFRTTYYRYPIVDQGVVLTTSAAPQDYSTDLLASRAVDFLRTAPPERPYFLEFAPSAPHKPVTPPPRYAGAFAGVRLPRPASFNEANVSDKPAWVRHLPRIPHGRARLLARARRAESEALLAVDDAVRRIVTAAAARGDLSNTVIFFLTDNGFSFGAHRWEGKECPYEECIRTPFAVRVPWARAGTLADVVSNVDLAPTIADFAGTVPGGAVDGRDLRPLIDPRSSGSSDPRPGALIEWLGRRGIPPWFGVRTANFCYVQNRDGTVELYDLTGRIGPADPGELDNRAGRPAYAKVRARLSSLLASLRAG